MKILRPAALLAPLILGSIARLGAGGELSGHIDLIGSDKKIVPAAGAVVWIPGVTSASAAAGALPAMASKEKRFSPHVVAVARGTVVTFPNLDKIHHNVFSRTPGSEFDLGLYRSGKSKEFRFSSPGVVRIYCNIHSQMAGYVLVLDGAAFGVADEQGAYRIGGVPDGRREVRIWHERAGETSTSVTLAAGQPSTLSVTLDGAVYREGPHKNKYGEDYPPVTRDEDRY